MSLEIAQTARSFARSQKLSSEIAQFIPGGVDSPFRAFTEVGGHTIFFQGGSGSRLVDVDGNEYIDYLGAWGPAVLGHCHPQIVAAAQHAVAAGAVFGAPHVFELEAARALKQLLPSMEKVRFVNSGTEAVMSAVRLARGATGRDLIVMFQGGYHGHSDSVLASQNHSSSAGVPQASAANTLLVPYNDLPALRAAFDRQSGKIAAILIEPVCGSMGVVAPDDGYLQSVAELCRTNGTLLIFDEVLTGLRVARGGAQRRYNIRPDLTCLGKALAGGMPIGAYGGRAELMDRLLPVGDVYQAGTFSGNPATMAAVIETIKLLDDSALYEVLERRTAQLFDGLSSAAKKCGQTIQLQRVGSMFAVIFAPQPVRNYDDHLQIDSKKFSRFFHFILQHGVYFPPSSVDAACVSAAHTETDIDETIDVCARAFKTL
ncbi:MAG TPA: glutamate-1-semialdehyde 2,1-aminomutase [Candidatus Obscuribacterales bacterium]